jgi:hypothetical protein
MKKIKLMMMTLMMCFVNAIAFGQWTHKSIDSDFDGVFKKSYTKINNYGYLAMEEGKSILVEDIRYDTTIISSDTVFGYMYKSFVGDYGNGLEVVGNGHSIYETWGIPIRENSSFWSTMLMESTDNSIVLSDTLYNNDFYRVMDININFTVDTIILSQKYIKHPLLYLKGSYFCDDNTTIDLVFMVKGIKKKYSVRATKLPIRSGNCHTFCAYLSGL